MDEAKEIERIVNGVPASYLEHFRQYIRPLCDSGAVSVLVPVSVERVGNVLIRCRVRSVWFNLQLMVTLEVGDPAYQYGWSVPASICEGWQFGEVADND